MAEIGEIFRLLPPGGRLLDIGTGTGIVPDTFRRLGHEVTSVDLGHKDALRKPLERLIELGVTGYWAEVGAEPIPVDAESMDVVFAGDVVEHIVHSPRMFMQDIVRVLRPGGWAVLTTPNAVRLPVRLKLLLGYSNWMPLSSFYDNDRNYGHHKEYDRGELQALLRMSGFDGIRVKMIEDTLRRTGVLLSSRDLRTQIRFGDNDGARFQFANPYEYARLAMSWATFCLPALRSSMLSIGQKPV